MTNITFLECKKTESSISFEFTILNTVDMPHNDLLAHGKRVSEMLPKNKNHCLKNLKVEN